MGTLHVVKKAFGHKTFCTKPGTSVRAPPLGGGLLSQGFHVSENLREMRGREGGRQTDTRTDTERDRGRGWEGKGKKGAGV